MARVSAAKSRSRSHSHSRPEVYSINTLKSEQEEEQSVSCMEWCWKGSKTLFNLTIASCECLTCWFSRRSRQSDPLQLEDNGSDEDLETRRMKEKLNFHFMNPFQKWRYSKRRRFPWKLLVQLISIVLVTTQLILFASTKFALTNYILENQSTFTQLFIRCPQDPDSDDPLPDPLSVMYTHDQLHNQFNYTIERFFSIDTLALGNYGYGWDESDNPLIRLVTTKYVNSTINPASKIFQVDARTYDECVYLHRDKNDLNWTKIKGELGQTVRFTFHFNITSVFFQDADDAAECIQFHLDLVIENDILAGNMPVTLNVNTDIVQCNNDSNAFKTESTILSSTGTTIVDVVVMIFAIISILQYLRSLFGSWKLSREVKEFFWNKFDYRLKFNQIVPLYNLWFVGVTISNLLVLVGCIFKLLIAYNAIRNIEVVDIASIVVGLAVFGQWCGLLRFLSYFDKYNILLITLRLSLPSVLRFIVCTGILYIAFLLCGWLVLGPYHPKFSDPFVTSECLFSLINGDDMFATYKGMSKAPKAAYIFSKVYLYVFIALFIYVVLSVFISLISDTYETLHEHWYERSKGLLVDFATGKLGQPHYHTAGPTHCHTDANILHDDHTQEEDYEYLREASHRFGPSAGDERPLMYNGGPELRRSSGASVGSQHMRARAVSLGSQDKLQSPVLVHVQGKGQLQDSWPGIRH